MNPSTSSGNQLPVPRTRSSTVSLVVTSVLCPSLPGVLALLLCWLPAAGPPAGELEMYLDGQLLRTAPNPSTELIVRTGSVGRIDLRIPDGGSFLGVPAGITSFANDRGSFAISAATTSTKTNTATLRWKREFIKLPDNVPFTY